MSKQNASFAELHENITRLEKKKKEHGMLQDSSAVPCQKTEKDLSTSIKEKDPKHTKDQSNNGVVPLKGVHS